jgi:hypothetical protein
MWGNISRPSLHLSKTNTSPRPTLPKCISSYVDVYPTHICVSSNIPRSQTMTVRRPTSPHPTYNLSVPPPMSTLVFLSNKLYSINTSSPWPHRLRHPAPHTALLDWQSPPRRQIHKPDLLPPRAPPNRRRPPPQHRHHGHPTTPRRLQRRRIYISG